MSLSLNSCFMQEASAETTGPILSLPRLNWHLTLFAAQAPGNNVLHQWPCAPEIHNKIISHVGTLPTSL